MSVGIIDIATSIIILTMGFSIFTALVMDYKLVSTVAKLIRKVVKVGGQSPLTIPLTPMGSIEVSDVRPSDSSVRVFVRDGSLVV